MTLPETPQPAFDAARADYLREARRPMNRLARMVAVFLRYLFSRHTGSLALIVAVTELTIGLCL